MKRAEQTSDTTEHSELGRIHVAYPVQLLRPIKSQGIGVPSLEVLHD